MNTDLNIWHINSFVQYQSLINGKFFLSELLTNDKALANIADHSKKMPTGYLHFSLIKSREMTSNIILLQNTNDKFALTYIFTVKCNTFFLISFHLSIIYPYKRIGKK